MVHWALCGLGGVFKPSIIPITATSPPQAPPTNILLPPLNQRPRLIQDKPVFTQTTVELSLDAAGHLEQSVDNISHSCDM